jgi:hypothetical protein
MSGGPASARAALSPFGALRPQFAADWQGEHELPPPLARFYAEVGPYGRDGPQGGEGLSIPTLGDPFWLPPLGRLWALQAGYRWDGRTGNRLAAWRDEWLVVAEQGGDPFVLDRTDGAILHGHHGRGAWSLPPIFADVFAMALVLGTIGLVHGEAGADLCDAEFELRPRWRDALRARLVPLLGDAGSASAAGRLGW